MVSLNHMLLKKEVFTLALSVAVFTSLHSAADDRKDLLVDLTCNVEQTYLKGIPYKKAVTYFLNKTQVGYIHYGTGYNANGICVRLGSIDKLIVESKFRSQGIGSYILKQALQDLKTNGYHTVQLEPKPFEAPIKDYWREREKLITFYKKNGFKVFNHANTTMQASLLSDILLHS